MTQRWRSHWPATALAAILLAGCGSGAPATPSPTLVPTAAPTAAPTPAPTESPAELAVKMFAAKDLRARVTLEGTADIGGTVITAAGTVDVIGDSEHETYEAKVGGEVLEAKEVISLGRDEWESLNDGPWHDADGTDDTALVIDLAELTALAVVGPETVDGLQLIHVRPGAGVTLDPKGWGPSDSAVTDYSIELDLWIAPDGTLAKIRQVEQWTRPAGASTVTVKSNTVATFPPLAASVTITKPADAWVAHTSTAMGYTVSQPSGYEVATEEGIDTFTAGEAAWLWVAASPVDADMTLADTLAALAESYGTQAAAELLMAFDTRVDGQAAKVAIFKFKDANKVDLRLVDAVAVVGGKAWEIYRVGTPDTVDQDVAYITQTLTTFSFAP